MDQAWQFDEVDLSTSFDDSMNGIGADFVNSMFNMRLVFGILYDHLLFDCALFDNGHVHWSLMPSKWLEKSRQSTLVTKQLNKTDCSMLF